MLILTAAARGPQAFADEERKRELRARLTAVGGAAGEADGQEAGDDEATRDAAEEAGVTELRRRLESLWGGEGEPEQP